MFFILFGFWGEGCVRSPNGLGHNLLMQFFIEFGGSIFWFWVMV